jgi:hypothetical protein
MMREEAAEEQMFGEMNEEYCEDYLLFFMRKHNTVAQIPNMTV